MQRFAIIYSAKTIKIIVLCFSVVLVAHIHVYAKGWRGIVPLHSTRADVEKLLGPPSGGLYNLDNETVFFVYSGEPCADNIPYGFNVPPDTVWEIHVKPKDRRTIADLKLDLSKYRKAADSYIPAINYYENSVEGIIIETLLCGDRVTEITHRPASGEDIPDCTTGNKIFDPVRTQLFDRYEFLSFAKEKARLDNLAVALTQESQMQGYIIVYTKEARDVNKAQERAKRAESYLINKRGIQADRIFATAIAGGEAQKVELILRPSIWGESPYGDINKYHCASR